ncbi:biosynthetic-type acetolactate synthase large subunit [Sulfoacidibacillus thermotolerans]|uniref:Acetolactate synthase n=1 Tax=Sulfoacidibacillus thermotolerans TaxID=1765684 RepID=A0A2U3DAW8_SULT2|nr:biosynthetic-type acetolactate synthase large subunit [Sulfoacidibacillus thermotolerans]PWI58421.1 acetolactate synthase, large subunit, biosynthetic type [Sulfoacidibacillus thermotolerans]
MQEPVERPVVKQDVNPRREVRTGAELLCSLLEQAGVDTIFGYPGGAVLPIYDALYSSPIRHILTRHEQGAIHAAQGFARVTGKPGIVLATSGPGATNLVTGIADAYMDSTPLVILTGQVPIESIGRDAFQEADIVGITMPVTKHNYQVRDIHDLPQVIADAFYIATTGRPGPVLIDLPKNITAGPASAAVLPQAHVRGYRLPGLPQAADVEAIIEAIRQAKKPLLYIGGGIVSSGASSYLREFAHRTKIPVVSTLMGLGAFPAHDPLFVGMLGMHGTYAANRAVTECDLLIALGVRFDDRVTGKLQRFSPHSTKIHVDIDAAEIGKNVPVHISAVADVGLMLQALLTREVHIDTAAWHEQILLWNEEWPLQYHASEGDLKPQQVVELIAQYTHEEAIITTEVGQHQMWAALFYPFSRPRQFVTSGGLGTMGFGFPAALGAQVARPDSTVICIAGDASFQMNIQELQTIVENQLPVKVAIINNRYLGMVRQWQQFFYESRYAESRIGSPDFAKVAQAYGALGLRAQTLAEAKTALETAFAYNGPVIIDFIVKEEENVFPMVPPGKGTDEMTLEWEE